MQRPVQIESTGSTIIWLAHHLGVPWQGIQYNYGSFNMICNNLTTAISLFELGCLIGGIIAILWQQWHKKLDIVQATIAMILVLLATGKVFSPQYLLWLIPLLAYSGAFNRFWLSCWGMISLLTFIIYSFFYAQFPTLTDASHNTIILPTGFLAVVSLRNILFVTITLAYLFNLWRARPIAKEIASSGLIAH